MNKIYIFSGLGVDERVFENIDFGNLNVEFVKWIKPEKNENIENYAQRISKIITVENPILIGLSFGGMIATEISKFLKTEKVILIASAKTRNELPWFYKIAGNLRLNKLVPNYILKQQNFIINWLFGIHSKSEKLLLRNIIKDTDLDFLTWAVNEIVNWKNVKAPGNYIHIHGNKDYVLPITNQKVDYIIENGGHFMTVNKAKEIEVIIKKLCE